MINNIEDILNNVYTIVERIIPILVPFVKFILPLVVLVGSFLRQFIGDFLFPLFPLFPESNNYLFWIIGSILILILAVVLTIIYPTRRNFEKI